MPDDDSTFANLAVDLNEESKAKRRGRPPKNPAPAEPTPAHVLEPERKEAPKADYNSPGQPHFPVYGESWHNPETGVTKWWHGSAWYLKPPGEEETEERDNALTEAALERVAEVLPETAPAGEPIPGLPESSDESNETFARDDTNFEPEEFEVDELAQSAIDRVGASLEGTGFDASSLVQDCRDFVIQLYKDRPKPWSALTQAEQMMLASQIENTMRDFVQAVVETVAGNHDHQPIRCMLESYTEKDGIKATLKVAAFSEEDNLAAVVGLHKARGKHVLVTVATVNDYSVDREAETEADAPDLPFEAEPRVHGGFEETEAEHPDDDSDLAGEDEGEESELDDQDDGDA